MKHWYTTADGKRRLADDLTVDECDAAARAGREEIAEEDRKILTGMAEEQADWDGMPEVDR